MSQAGLGVSLVALLVAALMCHYLFYLVPGLLGMKTGRPLYIVGTSTFGAMGGLLMPGFLMGVLQFGWLGVNIFFSSTLLVQGLGLPQAAFPILCILWGVAAAFIGLKGIQYVAKVATYLPFIPITVLLVMFFKTGLAASQFHPVAADPAAGSKGAWLLMISYVVGFFATAGAAGVDFGMNNRDSRDVKRGGLIGIALAIAFSAGMALFAVAGAHALKPELQSYVFTEIMGIFLGPQLAGIFLVALTIAAFPPACFSSFIAANSFKTTLPQVNPFVSVGIGAIISILIAITGWAGNLVAMFGLIGASFGPVCGAMAVEYFLNGFKWVGPRAGFNIPGWGAWLCGFIVGILPNDALVAWKITQPGQFEFLQPAPVVAFLVGAVVYLILAKLGLESKVLPLENKETH
jgi:cytosine permease